MRREKKHFPGNIRIGPIFISIETNLAFEMPCKITDAIQLLPSQLEVENTNFHSKFMAFCGTTDILYLSIKFKKL